MQNSSQNNLLNLSELIGCLFSDLYQGRNVCSYNELIDRNPGIDGQDFVFYCNGLRIWELNWWTLFLYPTFILGTHVDDSYVCPVRRLWLQHFLILFVFECFQSVFLNFESYEKKYFFFFANFYIHCIHFYVIFKTKLLSCMLFLSVGTFLVQ